MARVAVVPTAITRPPRALLPLTRWAVVSPTSNHSGCGASPASWEDNPVCKVIGAMITPCATKRATSSALNGRAALGISALPGCRAKIVWYAEMGKRGIEIAVADRPGMLPQVVGESLRRGDPATPEPIPLARG